MMKLFRQSISAKISTILVCMVLLCSITVGGVSLFLYRTDIIKSNSSRALAIAQATSSAIDAAEFEQIMQTLEKNEYWHNVKGIMDQIKVSTNVQYLYVLENNYTDTITYFVEGFDARDSDEEELDLGYQEDIVINGVPTFADEMYDVLRDGTPRATDIYPSGDFGSMVSGFAPIKASDGRIVGVVGIDISVNEVTTAISFFALRLVLIIICFCVIFGLLSIYIIRKAVGRPIRLLTEASDKFAVGDMNVELQMEREDELGRLIGSFQRMKESTDDQIRILQQLAGGDLTMEITPRSKNDGMSLAIANTLANLNDLFGDIKSSSMQVASGSDQIAQSAQELASGATQQAVTLDQFSGSVERVSEQAEANAQKATEAYHDAAAAGTLMVNVDKSMHEMTQSMESINESSQNIAQVIKAVEDIAFQTNILALNAAVEAARAGSNGKGFAVVADEVRNLANKSAEAAKKTSELIDDCIRRVSEGTVIVGTATESLQSVSVLAEKNAVALGEINESSQQQSEAISTITQDINEFAAVVQANSATSEQSAAASEEMSAQAKVLDSIVARFRTRGTAGYGEGNTHINNQGMAM